MADTSLLVVLDDSAASKRAVKYAGKMVGRQKGFRIYLLHVLPPLPPELAEHGGAEDPAKEAQIDADLRARQNRWISAANKATQRKLDEARALLRAAGVPAVAVKGLTCEPGENEDAADVILDMARQCKCRTIVVGREVAAWFQNMFSKQLADELHRRGKEFTVWAIE